MDKLPKRVHDIIMQYLRTKINTQPKFGFTQVKNRKILSFSHSLKSNPNMINDKNVQMHWGGFEFVFFLQFMFRLVLKATYLTWLHSSRQHSRIKVKNPKPRIQI